MLTGVSTSRTKTNKKRIKSSKTKRHRGHIWKEARQRAALTQAEVAEVLGYTSGQFISNVESGRCRFPGHQLAKLQKLYRLKTSEILNIVLKEEEEALREAFSRAKK